VVRATLKPFSARQSAALSWQPSQRVRITSSKGKLAKRLRPSETSALGRVGSLPMGSGAETDRKGCSEPASRISWYTRSGSSGFGTGVFQLSWSSTSS
jgi:hypothetical protein